MYEDVRREKTESAKPFQLVYSLRVADWKHFLNNQQKNTSKGSHHICACEEQVGEKPHLSISGWVYENLKEVSSMCKI